MSADLFAAFVAEDKKASVPSKHAGHSTIGSSNDLVEFQPSGSEIHRPQRVQEQRQKTPLWKRSQSGDDVLFDAEEGEGDDEFGDFENVAPSGDTERGRQTQASAIYATDLLNDDVTFANTRYLTLPTTRELAVIQEGGNESTKITEDDDWGDYEQTEAQEVPATRLPKVSRTEYHAPNPKGEIDQAQDDDWGPFDDQSSGVVEAPVPTKPTRLQQSTYPSSSTSIDRPTNVPPPSSLLQLLTTTFKFIHTSNASASLSKQELASRILVLYRTTSRIVAGRALRWKRDTILAQSMRIGQAGKSGGMKLAAVNRSETIKEQREAEDTIQDWSNYVHEFNSIIAQAGLPPQRLKLSSSAVPKTLNQKAISDIAKQCALCGLKRGERLSDVDIDADDLFGEFWIEHWGHKDCCEFWQSYKSMLDQR